MKSEMTCPFCEGSLDISECGVLFMSHCSNMKCIAGEDGAWAETEEEAVRLWEERSD